MSELGSNGAAQLKGILMKIGSLISGKKVAVISPGASAHDLVGALSSHHVGALVVSSDGKKIEGIVSERDVVRAMPGKLDQLESMRVFDLMTTEVVTCTSDSTVAELMSVMTERRIRHIPVVDGDGVLVSIVSIGDVVKAHISDIELEREALAHYVTQ
jgi:CBS domain-containing protein